MEQIIFQPVLTVEEWESGDLFSFMVYRKYENAREDYPNHTIAAYDISEIVDPTFVDDEDERTEDFVVDIPNSDGSWTDVATFKTREEAILFAQIEFGADEDGNINLISEIG